ncbi:MAG: hypothetical protein ACI85S_001371, partial [Pseudohongiellaceae bacterium]
SAERDSRSSSLINSLRLLADLSLLKNKTNKYK